MDLLKTAHDQETNNIDDVQELMQQLGLKHHFQEHKERDGFCKCCKCDCVSAGGKFYERIAGVKGPTCEKEVERMVRRIKYFLRSSSSDCDCTFGGGLDFPSTVEEFLKNDPPNE